MVLGSSPVAVTVTNSVYVHAVCFLFKDGDFPPLKKLPSFNVKCNNQFVGIIYDLVVKLDILLILVTLCILLMFLNLYVLWIINLQFSKIVRPVDSSKPVYPVNSSKIGRLADVYSVNSNKMLCVTNLSKCVRPIDVR